MMTQKNRLLFVGLLLALIASCCKEKKICKQDNLTIKPFVERYYNFECNNNNAEYTYIFTNSKQIDSLQPTCFFTSPTFFPIDETNMRYFIVGRLATHYKDTFQTNIYKDTCNKLLTYDLKLIQRDTTPFQQSGIQSMFCAVQNIPADYKVEVKYKYVPL